MFNRFFANNANFAADLDGDYAFGMAAGMIYGYFLLGYKLIPAPVAISLLSILSIGFNMLSTSKARGFNTGLVAAISVTLPEENFNVQFKN